jgi:hypothetical protein
MKRFVYFFTPLPRVFGGWIGALFLCATVVSPSAQGQSKSNLKSPATTTNTLALNAAAVESVFVMPKARPEGVDPFFPRSNGPYTRGLPVIPAPIATPQPTPIAVDLKLKAISGLPEHRLALINNHVFEAGEEGEVITNNGRMRIRCLEVHEDSAIVQVGSQRRDLRLKSDI